MNTSIKTRSAQQAESTTVPSAVIHDLSSAHYCVTYRITHDDGDYIIKQLRETATADERNRFHHSVRMQQALADTNISTPRITHYDTQRALTISEFHAHQSFLTRDVPARLAGIQAIAQQLSSLHATEVNIGIRYTPAQTYVSQYVDTIEQHLHNAQQPDDVQVAIAELRTFARTIRLAIERFDAQTDRVVLCHNDLNANNLLFNFNSGTPSMALVSLIDWEFAALNNPLFDLASLIFYLDLNASESEQLCQHYSNASARIAKSKYTDHIAINESALSLAQIVVRVLDSLWTVYESCRAKHNTYAESSEDTDTPAAILNAWNEQATARQEIMKRCEHLPKY